MLGLSHEKWVVGNEDNEALQCAEYNQILRTTVLRHQLSLCMIASIVWRIPFTEPIENYLAGVGNKQSS